MWFPYVLKFEALFIVKVFNHLSTLPCCSLHTSCTRSSPHPSTKAQPSTEEANGAMEELLATVANSIPRALDFQAPAMENYPEALASRWQLAKRIATAVVSLNS